MTNVFNHGGGMALRGPRLFDFIFPSPIFVPPSLVAFWHCLISRPVLNAPPSLPVGFRPASLEDGGGKEYSNNLICGHNFLV